MKKTQPIVIGIKKPAPYQSETTEQLFQKIKRENKETKFQQ